MVVQKTFRVIENGLSIKNINQYFGLIKELENIQSIGDLNELKFI